MTMWSTEWMTLYVLTILFGNLVVIAIASYANRRSTRQNRADKIDQ